MFCIRRRRVCATFHTVSHKLLFSLGIFRCLNSAQSDDRRMNAAPGAQSTQIFHTVIHNFCGQSPFLSEGPILSRHCWERFREIAQICPRHCAPAGGVPTAPLIGSMPTPRPDAPGRAVGRHRGRPSTAPRGQGDRLDGQKPDAFRREWRRCALRQPPRPPVPRQRPRRDNRVSPSHRRGSGGTVPVARRSGPAGGDRLHRCTECVYGRPCNRRR